LSRCAVLSVSSEPELPEAPGPPDPLETIPLPHLDGVEILVVDDESDGRALIGRILEGRGARIIGAGSAHEALQLLASRRFDVLLSDIGMPGVSPTRPEDDRL
jgi:PleD family two-component response regulator